MQSLLPLVLASTLLPFLGARQSALPAARQPSLPSGESASIAPRRVEVAADPRVPIGPATTPGDADSLYRIVTPGSYYLTRNLRGVVGKAGIEIAASGVTLDLQGFELAGGPGTLSAIRAVAKPGTQIAVRNGVLRGWGEHGLDAETTEGLVLEHLRSEGNAMHGFLLEVGGGLRECFASHNAGSGFRVGPGAGIRDCTALFNANYGFDVQGFGTLSGCVAGGNSYSGFQLARGVSAEGCTARANEDYGYIVSNGSTVVGCAATDNGIGYEVEDSLVRSCTASRNGSDGFQVGSGASILESISEENAADGIIVLGQLNRIDGNHVTAHAAGYGIRLVGSSNHLVRNTALGNKTDYALGTGNGFGVILSLSTGAITTSNPWANWQD